MTYFSTEQYTDAQRANVDAMYRFATEAFNGFEKLVALNLQTAKSSMDDRAQRWLHALSGNGPQAFFEVASGSPSYVERVAAYNRQVFDIVMGIQAALAQQAGAQYERQARKMQSGIDEAGKNAPAGSEAAVAALNSVVSATNTWYDGLYKTARQAVETAETNLNVVAGAAKRAQPAPAQVSPDRK